MPAGRAGPSRAPPSTSTPSTGRRATPGSNPRSTDAEGRVWFAPRSERQGPYFLLASKGRDLAFDPDYLYLYAGSKPSETSAALIYTDRSIYRPGQKLFWKILAFRGRRDLGKLRPAANAGASIWLEDINGQRVAEATCRY